MKKIALFLALFLTVLLICGFLIYRKVENEAFRGSVSISNITKDFEIKEGEGSTEVGENLQAVGLVRSKNYFYYYVWKTETSSRLQAGVYELAPNMTIGEIVEKMTKGDVKPRIVKLTVPEGFNNQKIIGLLRQKKPTIAEEFETIVNCRCLSEPECSCDKFGNKYPFLQRLPKGLDMEGYLFPDTYFIDEEDDGATLVSKFLNNYQKKVSPGLMAETERRGHSLHEVMTMASIIEREVKTDRDRRLVSGIFWNRVADDHPLQSCATLAYFLGVDKMQFSFEDTRRESPYNTYINVGLPPGPIANPGLSSIEAAVFPEDSSYYYFLSDLATGEIFYAQTIEDHERNKAAHGL